MGVVCGFCNPILPPACLVCRISAESVGNCPHFNQGQVPDFGLAWYNLNIMSRTRWQFWLAALMLIALPLKGLAAVGVVLCCPPGVASAGPGPQTSSPMVTYAGHDMHDVADVSASQASDSHGTPNNGTHAHDGADSGAKHVPCCGAAAMTAAPTGLPSPLDQRGKLMLPLTGGYVSAELAGHDKPPRS